MTDQTQTVPDRHSNIVGGSTAAVRIACPASYALSLKVPDDGGSVYAHEGTTLHEMMTILLNDPDEDPDDLLPFTFRHKDGWEYTVTADIWDDLGQPALNAFLDFCDWAEETYGGELQYTVEQEVAFPGIEGAFGTADIIWRCGVGAGVWDWKFGRTPVAAEGNKQPLFYLRAAMHSNPEFFARVEEFWVSIMQPQADHKDDTVEVFLEDIEEFREDLLTAIAEAQEHGENARLEKGPHCQWQRCKAICPAHIGPTLELGSRLAALKDRAKALDEKPTDFIASTLGGLEIADLLELAEVAQAWSKELFAVAQRTAEEDETARAEMETAGWLLKPKRSSGREWCFEEKKMVNRLRSKGLKKADMYEPAELRSPAQIEKVFKKLELGKLPDGWAAAKPSSGATLVREHEGVERYESNAEKMRALAERLSPKG